MHRASPWATFLPREGNLFREAQALNHVKIWNSLSNSSLVSVCLILRKIQWRLSLSVTWDGLHWKCLAVKACKTGNNVNSWYFSLWLFKAFKLLPNKIWHLLGWWGWEMSVFKQLCLYFSECYSAVIHPHCGFLAVMSHIGPFCTSDFKDIRVVFNLLRHILPHHDSLQRVFISATTRKGLRIPATTKDPCFLFHSLRWRYWHSSWSFHLLQRLR